MKTLTSLKPVEDMLDALICAWIGIEHLENRTVGLGDSTAAIWVPDQSSGSSTPSSNAISTIALKSSSARSL